MNAKFRAELRPGVEPTMNGATDIILQSAVLIPSRGDYSFSIMMGGEEKWRIPFRALTQKPR